MSVTTWNNKKKPDKGFQTKDTSGWFSIVQEITKLYDTYLSSHFEILSLKLLISMQISQTYLIPSCSVLIDLSISIIKIHILTVFLYWISALWNWFMVLVKMVTPNVKCGWIHSKLERAGRGQSTSLFSWPQEDLPTFG